MTSINLKLNTLLPNTASRETGTKLRSMLIDHLQHYNHIEIDFSDVTLTPSFADEAFGLLCHHISFHDLMQRIKFLHLSDTHKVLLKRVISNRFHSS